MTDTDFMRVALRLARRGRGTTSPNPMVGALVVRAGQILGRGWHHRAGENHAEIEAMRDAAVGHGHSLAGATLYVTLEPCSTQGRTPACTGAIIEARIKRVVVGATDPNPAHAGCGFEILRRAGIEVVHGVLAEECDRLNEVFNQWIVRGTPLVTVKAAMTLDGKIATASGESKWITGERARAHGMKLRWQSDAILVGINTILADDPSLTVRPERRAPSNRHSFRRIVLDSQARTPLTAKIVTDAFAGSTIIVVGKNAPKRRVAALAAKVNVLVAPTTKRPAAPGHHALDLRWLLKRLGRDNITSLLVEGGGEVNASFLLGGFAQRVAFFYAPKILGGRDSRKAVAGDGARTLRESIPLTDLRWQKLGPDLLLTARVG